MPDITAVVQRVGRVSRRAAKAARQLTRLTFDPALTKSYWPELSRKSAARRFTELTWWLLRHGEINNYYYVYGLDIRGRTRGDVLPYRSFRKIRNRANLRTGRAAYNYVCVLRDKFLFGQLVRSFGLPTPTCLALLTSDSVTWLDRNITASLPTFLEYAPDFDGFAKPLDGIQGDGAFPLKVSGGQLTSRDQPLTLDALRTRINGRYLLQSRIDQHESMSALNPTSVNTVRLITFCRERMARVIFGAVRIGRFGKSVDNWAAGGLIVRLDLATETLQGEGFLKPGYGGRCSHHPDSGIKLDGYAIPHLAKAIQAVTRLHELIPDIHSIGWDVAITPEGPVIIEGNDDWEGGIPMVLERDFKQRFLAEFKRRDRAGSAATIPTTPNSVGSRALS